MPLTVSSALLTVLNYCCPAKLRMSNDRYTEGSRCGKRIINGYEHAIIHRRGATNKTDGAARGEAELAIAHSLEEARLLETPPENEDTIVAVW